MKLQFITLGALSLCFLSCSHQRYEQDRGTEAYNNRPNAYTSPTNRPGGQPDPATAPILALIGVASLGMNPHYYEKSSIGGKCVVQTSAADTLGAPCNNIVVVLYDQDSGKEVGRRPCSIDGLFSFTVEKNKKYQIGILSERYALPASDRGPFSQGQELLLTLKPNTAK